MTYAPASRFRAGLMTPRHAEMVEGTRVWAGTSGGSANAQTLTPSPALGSLAGNSSYEFLAGYSITGAATLNVSGTGDLSLRRADGVAAGIGDVVAGTKYVVTLVSGQWRLDGGGGANLATIHAALAAFR